MISEYTAYSLSMFLIILVENKYFKEFVFYIQYIIYLQNKNSKSHHLLHK